VSGAPVILARFMPYRIMLGVMFLGMVMFTVAAAGVLLNVDPEKLRQGSTFIRLSLWGALVLCPVFGVDMLVRLVRRTPTVVAAEDGLALRSILGFAPAIPWKRIVAFRPVVISKKTYLGIYLDDPRDTLTGFGTWMQLMHVKSLDKGAANIVFRSFQLGVAPEKAAEVLERIRAGREGA
jgi:hypothetical protein